MKNLLDDPEVMKLYQDLQNAKYNDLDDFLTSSPVDDRDRRETTISGKQKLPAQKVFWNGEEVSDYIEESNDYGL